jgi:hypothetical protein
VELLRDPAAQAAFDREGWITLPLLDEHQVRHLRAFYDRTVPPEGFAYPFHYSFDHPDAEHARLVRSEVLAVAADAIARHFVDPAPFMASFAVKESHPDSAVGPHQDWTFVDETRWRSAVAWIPLLPVDAHNGGLGVIPRSHRLFGTRLRCSPAPQCASTIGPHSSALLPSLHVPRLAPGEALVFDNALVHGSWPNLSDARRVAVGIGMTAERAEVQHHFLVPGTSEVASYAVDPDFYCRYGNPSLSALYESGRCPEGARLLGREPYATHQMSWAELAALLGIAVAADDAARPPPALARGNGRLRRMVRGLLRRLG